MARVKTTPMVRIALWAIRIYLLVLLTLIGLKFLRVSSATEKTPPPTAAPAASADRPKS
jgi:hypothetical protein